MGGFRLFMACFSLMPVIERSVTTLDYICIGSLMDKYCTVETYFMVNKHT